VVLVEDHHVAERDPPGVPDVGGRDVLGPGRDPPAEEVGVPAPCSVAVQGRIRPAQMIGFPLSCPIAFTPRIRIGRTVAKVSRSIWSVSREPNWLWQ